MFDIPIFSLKHKDELFTQKRPLDLLAARMRVALDVVRSHHQDARGGGTGDYCLQDHGPLEWSGMKKHGDIDVY